MSQVLLAHTHYQQRRTEVEFLANFELLSLRARAANGHFEALSSQNGRIQA